MYPTEASFRIEARVARSYHHGPVETKCERWVKHSHPEEFYTVSAFYRGDYEVPSGRSMSH